jgi:hypothetical protein
MIIKIKLKNENCKLEFGSILVGVGKPLVSQI